jgi:hypothetical protein
MQKNFIGESMDCEVLILFLLRDKCARAFVVSGKPGKPGRFGKCGRVRSVGTWPL